MKKYIADILTFSRIVLSIFLIFWGIFGGHIGVGFVIFILAELTDSFDGTCSRKWPFPKGKEPRYRKYAVMYDMIADALLWFSAVLFFTLRVNLVAGLVIMFGVAILCGIIELVVYGRLFGHPDTCKKNSLCAKNFNVAKKIVMGRRFFYLFTIVLVAAWTLCACEWPEPVRLTLFSIGVCIAVFLWFFLETRRKNISRDAIDIEKKLAKKAKK